MKGFRYFLVVLVAIAGLSFAAKLVYSRNPALAKSVVEVETPAAVERKSAPVDPSRAAPPVERTSAVSAPSGAEVRRAPGTQSSGPASPVKRRATVARPTPGGHRDCTRPGAASRARRGLAGIDRAIHRAHRAASHGATAVRARPDVPVVRRLAPR